MISKKQLNLFWKMFARLTAEVCPGASKDEREIYRHKFILKVTKCHSIKDVTNNQFERLMAAMAAELGDYEEAVYWGFARDRRLIDMCRSCARQIGEITDRELDDEYFKTCFHRPFVQWERIPPADILAVFQMLDTYRRRLLKKAGWGDDPKRHPLAFSRDRRYIINPDQSICFYDLTSVSDFD